MSGLKFIKNFMKSPASIGAVCPTSKYLSQKIVSNVKLEEASVAVELGPGTGPVTPYLLEKLKPEAQFFAVELNDEFYYHFKELFPEVRTYHESASNLLEIMEKENVKGIDTVISGLPWASFSNKLQDEILTKIVEALNPGGYFTTFAYLQGTILPTGRAFKRKLDTHFSSVVPSDVEWRNIPPSIVYRCRK